MRAKAFFSFILLFLSVLSPSARAAGSDDQGSGVAGFMPCRGPCANFVPAKPIFQDELRVPGVSIRGSRRYSDSLVNVLYTIGPDGKVRGDVLVLNLIGSREFADKVVEKVRTWSFEPATSNGKPVAQNQTQRIILNVGGSPPQSILTRIEVLRALKHLPLLMGQNKTEEARAELEDVLRNVPLSFSERAAIAAPLAGMALQRGDYLEARRLAGIATLSSSRGLGNAWVTRIKADLELGDISDALYSFSAEQAQVGEFADSTQPIAMQKARADADVRDQLKMLAEIPATDEGDAYTFVPYRRTFTFQGIQGSLQKFILSCRQATTEVDITPMKQWRIPNNWNGCSVYVRGAPQTKFLVLELKD